MKLRHMFRAAYDELGAFVYLVSYTTAAGCLAYANHAAGGDHRFTVFALCISALSLTALLSLIALIIVTIRRLNNFEETESR